MQESTECDSCATHPDSGLPNPKSRNTGKYDCKYKPHVGEIRNQRVPKQKHRRNEKNRRRYRISPDTVRPREVRPFTTQDVDCRNASRVERPDGKNEGIGELFEIANHDEYRA